MKQFRNTPGAEPSVKVKMPDSVERIAGIPQ